MNLMVHDILLHKFQYSKLTELTGGYTNSSILLEGSEPLVVAKIFNAHNRDSITEMNCLTLLNNSGVSPKMHDYFEDNGSQYIIMDYVHGINSQSFLDDGDINKAKEIYKLLGIHLAKDIHSIKWRDGDPDLPIIELINIDIDALNYVPNNQKEKVKHIFNISVIGEKTLIHGDYGPHNAILSNKLISIIDWEWAGWGNPLQDVSWVIWFVHLHYPNFSRELSEIFINAYSEFSDLKITNELVKVYSVSRVINVLDRIKYTNEEVKNEWLRRLEWTLETNFVG
ncbi:MAG TPA: aminoglycoside phosphotransferase family protein [Paenibacillus sp.]|uniref:aminoglycoside phosphotransferase family protein n=1 Tax=Paenibacillus TaxID=44249 RepID=UPI000BA16921|nr:MULTISPECIES: aminoglycoside phosphotransferase family protein [Paenibacillus]OZQ67079.1 hypothetical protein CA599_17905 [Paenibacillus taichungensis]HBU81624.1 aminoglycoside phosphotransferase family protein [Paenibacillus sp.]